MIDIAMLIHLFIYPLLTGMTLVAALWALSDERAVTALLFFCGFLAVLLLTLSTHANYQSYGC